MLPLKNKRLPQNKGTNKKKHKTKEVMNEDQCGRILEEHLTVLKGAEQDVFSSSNRFLSSNGRNQQVLMTFRYLKQYSK